MSFKKNYYFTSVSELFNSRPAIHIYGALGTNEGARDMKDGNLDTNKGALSGSYVPNYFEAQLNMAYVVCICS